MTATATLVGLGMPDLQARRIGFANAPKTGVGTTQTGATPIGGNMTTTTTSGGNTAFLLPLVIGGTGPFVIFNPSATAALIFPQTGESINGGSANASVSIAQNASRIFYKLDGLNWSSFLSG